MPCPNKKRKTRVPYRTAQMLGFFFCRQPPRLEKSKEKKREKNCIVTTRVGAIHTPHPSLEAAKGKKGQI
jgi:hypothetical protein